MPLLRKTKNGKSRSKKHKKENKDYTLEKRKTKKLFNKKPKSHKKLICNIEILQIISYSLSEIFTKFCSHKICCATFYRESCR